MTGTQPFIHIVYPSATHQVYDDSTFLMGAVRRFKTDNALIVNRQAIPISQHGYFTAPILLKEGKNPITLELFGLPDRNGKPPLLATRYHTITRVAAYPELPQSPLSVHPETLTPQHDQWLGKNSTLEVACSASVNANASIVIPGLIDTPVPMTCQENSTDRYYDDRIAIFAKKHWTHRRIPNKGYYTARIPLATYWSDTLDFEKVFSIELHLSHGNQHFVQVFPAKLHLLNQQITAMVHQDRAITRLQASDYGARISPQRAGTLLLVNQVTNGWCQTELGFQKQAYIHQDSLTVLERPQSLPPQLLQVIKCHGSTHPNRARISLSGARQVPQPYPVSIQLQPSPDMNRLECTFYDMQSQCDFIHYSPEANIIQQVHWRPVNEQTLEVWLDLEAPVCGYDYYWKDNHWHVTVKSLPENYRDIRILIDPGHGGSEIGSVGLNGIPEKTLNLTVSKQLEAGLQAKGFTVFMSRGTDVEVSLEARQQKAIEVEADIVLSIHHNALPDGRNPLEEYGTSTFYYHPFAKKLASTLLNTMSAPHDHFSFRKYGVLYDSLFIPRIHQATSVLLELGFFTHPQEFEQLINPEFQKIMVNRIVSGLEQYCHSIKHSKKR